MHAALGVTLCAGVHYGGVVRHDSPPSTPESNPDQADCLTVGAEQQWQLPTTPAQGVYQFVEESTQRAISAIAL